MEASDKGQVDSSAAEVYQKHFVPALFEEWAGRVVDAADIKMGNRVLDVACGTGVVARAARERVGPGGMVVGLDVNEGMLKVAQRISSGIEWKQGRVESLPYPDNDFDAVTCQFGLMFFDDRAVAVREMWRVLKPGSKLAVAVWDSAENSPGYAALIQLLEQLFNSSVADMLRSPFNLGDRQLLCSIFEQAGIPDPQLRTITGTAHFPSLQDWIFIEIKGWTLANALNNEQYDLLCREAAIALKRFEQPDGSCSFPAPAHIMTATK